VAEIAPEYPEALLEADRADLLAVLCLRFGEPPREVASRIGSIRHPDVLARLILAAANAPTLAAFLDELDHPLRFRLEIDPFGEDEP